MLQRLNLLTFRYYLRNVIIYTCIVIGSSPVYISSALSSRHSLREDEAIYTYRHKVGKLHEKIEEKHDRVNFNNVKSCSSITTVGTLLLLFAHLQPSMAQHQFNFASMPMSPRIDYTSTEIFSATNSTSSLLRCEEGANILGSHQAHSFSSLEFQCSHSGMFALNRNIKTVESFTEARIKDFVAVGESGKIPSNLSEKELIGIYKKRLPAFSGLYKFNGRPVDDIYNHMSSHTYYENALKWAEKEILPKKLSQFKTSELINLFSILNKRLNGTVDQNSLPFREGVVVIWDDSGGIPNFDQPAEMSKYLAQHSPRELKLYSSLCKMLEGLKGSEALLSTDEWNIFLINNIFKTKKNPYLDFVNKYYTYNDLSPTDIKRKLRKAINDYKFTSTVDPIKASAKLHLDLVDIHPFEDGNGRTARVIMNISLKQAGKPSIIVYDQYEYTQAIKNSLKQGKVDIFVKYVQNQICRQVELFDNPEFGEGKVLKKIAENCEYDCSQEFFRVSQKFKL